MISSETELRSLFETLIERIGRSSFLSSIDKQPIVAYSGGKDSSICLAFFEYLHKQYGFLSPAIFHLNHGIRDNSLQEEKILSFVHSRFPRFFFIKKKFLIWQNA